MIAVNYHEAVPRSPGENLLYRKWLLDRCRQSAAARAAVREVCRRDLLFFTNSFAWQFNPRKKGGEVGPFVTWDFQDALLRKIDDFVTRDEDFLEEKSREVGATWGFLIIIDWRCHFRRLQSFLCVSHTEDAVDKAGDPKSLFWKLRFMHDRLPRWLAGTPPASRKLCVEYPATGSVVTGAATTRRAGVGGRVTAVFLDEFGLQENADEIWSNTADLGCRVVVSTHYGVGTCYYKLSRSGRPRKEVVHWSQHPEKRRGLYRAGSGPLGFEVLDGDYEYPPGYEFVREPLPAGGPFPGLRSPWYDEEVRRRGSPRDVAMHLDIDPQGSADQVFDPGRVHDHVRLYARDPDWRGTLAAGDDGRPVRLVSDPAGPLKLWCHLGPDDRPPDDRYGAGCDLSRGTGATPTCMAVMNGRGEKVAEFTHALLRPDEFAPVAVALCRLFHDAAFAWEANGPGEDLAKVVLKLGYLNIFWKKKNLGSAFTESDSDRPGWYSTPRSKTLLITDYARAIYQGLVLNPSEDALRECLSFSWRLNNVEHGSERVRDASAAGVNHGDHVIADALAWMMVRDWAETRTAPAEVKRRAELDVNTLAGRLKFREDRLRRASGWI